MEERKIEKRGRKKRSTVKSEISRKKKSVEPLGPDLESAMRIVKKIADEGPPPPTHKRKNTRKNRKTGEPPKKKKEPEETKAPETIAEIKDDVDESLYVLFDKRDEGTGRSAKEEFAMKLSAAMRNRSGPDEIYARPIETFIEGPRTDDSAIASTSMALIPTNQSRELIVTIPPGAVVEKLAGKTVVMQRARDFLSGRTMVTGEHVCGPGTCEYVKVSDIVTSESECESIASRLELQGILSSDASDSPEVDDVYVCSVGGSFHDCRSDRCSDCLLMNGFLTCWKSGRTHGTAYTGVDPNQFKTSSRQDRMSSWRSRKMDDTNARSVENFGWKKTTRAPGGGVETCRRAENQSESAPWEMATAEARRRIYREEIKGETTAAAEAAASDPMCEDSDGDRPPDRSKDEAWEDGPPIPDKRRKRGVKRTSVVEPSSSSSSTITNRTPEVIDGKWLSEILETFGHIMAGSTCARYSAALETPSASVSKEISLAETIARTAIIDLPSRAAKVERIDPTSAWNKENIRTYSKMMMRAWILVCATQNVDRFTNVMIFDIAKTSEARRAKTSVSEREIPRIAAAPPATPQIAAPKFVQCALGAIYLTITGYEVCSDMSDVSMPDDVSKKLREILVDTEEFASAHRITFVSLNTYLAAKLVPEVGVSKACGTSLSHPKGRASETSIRIDSQVITAGRSAVQDRLRDIATWSLVKFVHEIIVDGIDPAIAMKNFDHRSSYFKIDDI